MPHRYDDRYRQHDPRRDREFADDRGYDERGYMARAGDEVRSWFGDEEAARRRHEDEERGRYRERDWRLGGRGEPARYDEGRARGDYRDRAYVPGREREWDRERGLGRDWPEPEPWAARDREGADRDWWARERAWTDDDWRGRDWRDRDREWGDRERDWSWRSQPLGARPYREGRWDVDEGRTQFGPPARGMGYAYPSGAWQQRGRGPKNYKRSDTRIYEDICDRLSLGDVDAENIEVSVSNGEVTLSGTVRDREDKYRAEDIAESVLGVRDVHNNIRVQREGSLGMSETSTSNQPGSMLGISPDPGTKD